MIVGLAIDYIVHVAQGFHLSKGATRKDKIEQVLHEIGISVFAGAGTTLGASFFMLFAQILFFHQHGLFMFCTTAFALMYAMGTLVVLLSRFGPETNKYSVSGALKRVFHSFFHRRATEESVERPDTVLEETDSICTTTTTLDGSIPNIKFRSQSRNSEEEKIVRPAPKQTKGVDKTRLRVLKKEPNDSNSSSIDDDNISSGYESGATTGVPKMLSCQLRPNNNLVSLPVSDFSETDDSPELRRKGLAQKKTVANKIETILEESCCPSERATPVNGIHTAAAGKTYHSHTKPHKTKHSNKRHNNSVEPLNVVALNPEEKIRQVLVESENLVRLAQQKIPPERISSAC